MLARAVVVVLSSELLCLAIVAATATAVLEAACPPLAPCGRWRWQAQGAIYALHGALALWAATRPGAAGRHRAALALLLFGVLLLPAARHAGVAYAELLCSCPPPDSALQGRLDQALDALAAEVRSPASGAPGSPGWWAERARRQSEALDAAGALDRATLAQDRALCGPLWKPRVEAAGQGRQLAGKRAGAQAPGEQRDDRRE
eukprot:m51a1_g7768 hypothetical protein (203) ;mRNA; f:146179-147878